MYAYCYIVHTAYKIFSKWKEAIIALSPNLKFLCTNMIIFQQDEHAYLYNTHIYTNMDIGEIVHQLLKQIRQ